MFQQLLWISAADAKNGDYVPEEIQ